MSEQPVEPQRYCFHGTGVGAGDEAHTCFVKLEGPKIERHTLPVSLNWDTIRLQKRVMMLQQDTLCERGGLIRPPLRVFKSLQDLS